MATLTRNHQRSTHRPSKPQGSKTYLAAKFVDAIQPLRDQKAFAKIKELQIDYAHLINEYDYMSGKRASKQLYVIQDFISSIVNA
jgi:hypothetical protein